MATPPKDNGRQVGDHSGNADLDLAAAKQRLFKALTSQSTDPISYINAIGEALEKIEMAHTAVREISDICKLAAVRGPYGEKE